MIVHWWFITVPEWGWRSLAHHHVSPGLIVLAIVYGIVTLIVSTAILAALAQIAGSLIGGFRKGLRGGDDPKLRAARVDVARALRARIDQQTQRPE